MNGRMQGRRRWRAWKQFFGRAVTVIVIDPLVLLIGTVLWAAFYKPKNGHQQWETDHRDQQKHDCDQSEWGRNRIVRTLICPDASGLDRARVRRKYAKRRADGGG